MNIGEDLILIPKSYIEDFFKTHLFQAFQATKEAYLQFHHGQAINPPSNFLWYNDEERSRIIGLSAYIKKENSHPGIKWISSSPNNITRGLPRASGVIILNDFKTGYPIAVLEASLISALRTALSALLALEYLQSNKKISRMGIIGSGVIASHVIQCAKNLGWEITSLCVYDQQEERSEAFLTQHSYIAPGEKATLDDVLAKSDVILFATTVTTPYISTPKLFKKNSIILNLSLRDIGPEVILSAYNIVDDIEHVLAANTAPHLAFLQSGNKDFIAGSLASLIEGTIKNPAHELKIFSPMGMGILDIALANLVFLSHAKAPQSLVVQNFFS